MTNTENEMTVNEDALIAVYDNIPYIWQDNGWVEVELKALHAGGEK